MHEESAKLRALRALAPKRLIHHWYAPVRLRAYALYTSLIHVLCALRACRLLSSSIGAWRTFVLSCYKYRCVCQQEISVCQPQTPLLGKTSPKYQNCYSKLKFDTQINSNMQNSMVVFTFSIFDRKYLFLGKFGSKNQNCQFKLKRGT